MKHLTPGNKLLLFLLFGIVVFTLLPGCPNPPTITCLAPVAIGLDTIQINRDGSRTLVYKWTAVTAAQSYRFTFARNNQELIDTTISTNSIAFTFGKEVLNINDILVAQVFTNCPNGVSDPTTSVVCDLDGTVGHDIVFFNGQNQIDSLCELNCNYYHFPDSIFITIAGDTIRVDSFYRNYFYSDADFRKILCTDSTLTQAIFDSIIPTLYTINLDGPDSLLQCNTNVGTR